MSEDIQRRIREKISEIESKSADGAYIYRGEPETHEEYPYYGKVSSSLWRDFVLETEGFNIEAIQTEILAGAKSHIGDLPQDYRVALATSLNVTQEEADRFIDFEILAEIQHYGGKTNLIDFTTDYLIALFFACDGHHNKEGRVILQKTEEIQDIIEYPRNPRHRVSAQKSIFVRPPKGFIDKPHEDNVVIIEHDLKQWILDYLQQEYGISKATIYNDVYGFIEHEDIHGDAYTFFYRGFAFQIRGDETPDSQLKQKEYEKSIEYYAKALEFDPRHAQTYYNRGLAYFKSDKFESAIVDFTEAIKLNPSYVDAYNNRGVAYYKSAKYECAITDYTQAIALNPIHVPTHSNRGRSYAEIGDYELAIADCNRAIELDSRNFRLYDIRGYVYGRKGDYELAITDFNKAVELNPKIADVYNNRGYVYGRKGDYELAIADFNKAIELDPNYAPAHSNRGYFYLQKGDYELAIADYTEAIKLNPNSLVDYYNRGEVRLHLEEWREAKKDLAYAKDIGIDIVAAFHEEYENVADFQRRTGITLPPDIAQMLTATQS